MTKKRGPGRPKMPKAEVLGTPIRIRLKSQERRKINAAAKRAGVSVSAWARAKLLRGL